MLHPDVVIAEHRKCLLGFIKQNQNHNGAIGFQETNLFIRQKAEDLGKLIIMGSPQAAYSSSAAELVLLLQ